MKLYSKFLIFVALMVFAACQKQSSEQLHHILQSIASHEPYNNKDYPLGLFTEHHYAAEADFSRTVVEQLEELDLEGLSESEQITVELLRFKHNDIIDYYEFESYLNPLLSDAGFHNNLNYMVRPLKDMEAVNNYLNKLRAIPVFVDQHFVNLRKGLQKGVSQPRIIFEGYESTYNDHIVENYEDSFFFKPFKDLPPILTDMQQDSIRDLARNVISKQVIPQFERIKTFFETEYLPTTRTSIGLSEIPNGEDYYQNRINYYTTSTSYTADQIHQIGIKEVARIKAQMLTIISDLGFKGTFKSFLDFLRTDQQFYVDNPEELLMIARDISKRLDEQLPKFFKTLPRKPYGVAPVPDAIAPKYTTGRYVGTSKTSSDPGYYWVNTYNLKSRKLYTLPALTAHEAVPGHHLQGALNTELGDHIPQFRKNLYLSAYGEGWGLYAEYLAEDMGIYTTPYENFGKLTYEMWRACRLVVDTGIHAKGWTRNQVVDYLSENTALSLHEIGTETDRYISWPGQAISYKIGELKIRELKQRAVDKLGAHFDIQEFHEVILEEGTVTLAILEKRIEAYIQIKSDEINGV